MKILWNDFETGGTDPLIHSPLSFAMIATDGDQVIGEWYTEIRELPLVLTPQALAINKIDIHKDGISFNLFREEYFNKIRTWFYKGQKPSKENMPFYGGHNTAFDRPILKRIVCSPNSSFDGCYYHHIDTMSMAVPLNAAGVIKVSDYKLETLAKYFDIVPKEDLHNALTDVRLTMKIYQEMKNLLRTKEWITK